MFKKLVGLALVTSVAACGGDEGPHWQGSVEHDGVTVEYETYYAPPSLIEKINNSDGIAARIAIGGKTMMLSPGVKHPPEWEERGNFMDYSPEFWREVTDKFKAISPGKDHEDEHYLLNNLLEALRDSQRTLPPTPASQALTSGPVCAHDLAALAETESEAAYSRKMGELMAAHLQAEERERGWASSGSDPSRAKNRGYRPQNGQAGYEFRQRLEVWADHALFGWDHSGTRVVTYRRPKGSSAAWEQMGDPRDACNHGDCPGQKKMRLREVCDPGNVSDWYVVDGECEGNWMSSHLCNDDTSLQISHAHGVWTGWRCPGAKRGIVPKCGRQFR